MYPRIKVAESTGVETSAKGWWLQNRFIFTQIPQHKQQKGKIFGRVRINKPHECAEHRGEERHYNTREDLSGTLIKLTTKVNDK